MITMQTESTIQGSPYAPTRVHIAPIGFEEDRIVLPAKQLKAEKVILVANELAHEKASGFYEAVKARLEKDGIDYDIVRAPIFQLEANMKLFSDLIKEHSKEQLFINISSGSKIQALAGYISAMAAKSEGIQVTIYYVEPEKYTEDPPVSPISHGCRRILALPIFPLPSPTKEIRFAMTVLQKKTCSKLELAIELARGGLFDKKLLDGSQSKPINEKARIGLQNSVDAKVIQPLLREKYAKTEKTGRKVMVSLTELGEEASHLFAGARI